MLQLFNFEITLTQLVSHFSLAIIGQLVFFSKIYHPPNYIWKHGTTFDFRSVSLMWRRRKCTRPIAQLLLVIAILKSSIIKVG